MSVRSKVIDPDSGADITQPGTPGELCFAGATVFDGYLGDSDEDVFTADGYFRTGDLVEICGEPPNYYRIVGRCKDIINRGGMKILPVEIDTLLEASPGWLKPRSAPTRTTSWARKSAPAWCRARRSDAPHWRKSATTCWSAVSPNSSCPSALQYGRSAAQPNGQGDTQCLQDLVTAS